MTIRGHVTVLGQHSRAAAVAPVGWIAPGMSKRRNPNRAMTRRWGTARAKSFHCERTLVLRVLLPRYAMTHAMQAAVVAQFGKLREAGEHSQREPAFAR